MLTVTDSYITEQIVTGGDVAFIYIKLDPPAPVTSNTQTIHLQVLSCDSNGESNIFSSDWIGGVWSNGETGGNPLHTVIIGQGVNVDSPQNDPNYPKAVISLNMPVPPIMRLRFIASESSEWGMEYEIIYK